MGLESTDISSLPEPRVMGLKVLSVAAALPGQNNLPRLSLFAVSFSKFEVSQGGLFVCLFGEVKPEW